MAKAKAKVNEKTLDVLTKTKKPAGRRGRPQKSQEPVTQTQLSRSRSRSRTPSRTVKVEKPVAPKSEPKKSAPKKPKTVNNSVSRPKSEPAVKRLDGEAPKKRATSRKSTIPKNSTPKKRPPTPTRKQPRRIAAINSGNSFDAHKMEEDFVDSPISVDYNQGDVRELEGVSPGSGGGWLSRCSIM